MNNHKEIDSIVRDTNDTVDNEIASLKIVQDMLDEIKQNPKRIFDHYHTTTALVQSSMALMDRFKTNIAIHAHKATAHSLDVKKVQHN